MDRPSKDPETLMLSRAQTVLVVVDMQERLANAMDPHVLAGAVRYNRALLAAARLLGMPVIMTEQYPRGLGTTLPELREDVSETLAPVEKLEFSAAEAAGFLERLQTFGARQVILTGMETHICVLQTALGLLSRDLGVWVAQDATCARVRANWQAGLTLAAQGGAVVAPTETILFMLLERAGTPEFKAISQLIR